MRIAALVLAEAWHRRTSALLTLLAVAVAVAVVNLLVLLLVAGEQETRLIQRDMGLNLLILPAATDPARYWALGYSPDSMPAEYIERVEGQEVANRLIPLLRRRVEWRGGEVMLTGIAPEVFKGGERMKPVFGMSLDAGTLVVGGAIARRLGLERGQQVELLGETFSVRTVLAETGTEEDVRVYADLADVQRLLDLEGRINEIQALECHCGEDVADPLATLRAELEVLLPGTRVVRKERAAEARRRQRLLAERFLAIGAPVVLLLCGLWIGTLAMLNVRERRAEIGVLRALGFGARSIAGLFLGRAALLGALGAAVGGLMGLWLGSLVGSSIFTRSSIEADAGMLLIGLVAAPAFAALASLVPAALGATEDPAEVLRDA